MGSRVMWAMDRAPAVGASLPEPESLPWEAPCQKTLRGGKSLVSHFWCQRPTWLPSRLQVQDDKLPCGSRTTEASWPVGLLAFGPWLAGFLQLSGLVWFADGIRKSESGCWRRSTLAVSGAWGQKIGSTFAMPVFVCLRLKVLFSSCPSSDMRITARCTVWGLDIGSARFFHLSWRALPCGTAWGS